MTTDARQRAYRLGHFAELCAVWRLRLAGYSILERRYKTRLGEIDIVARRGGILAFIEVKARASDEAAADALDDYRLRRVARAAEALAPRFARPDDTIRIDAIFMVPHRWPRHLANVWHG